MKKQYGLALLLATFLVISSLGVGISVINRAEPARSSEQTNPMYYDITVFKYYDVNGNGHYEEGVDYPLENWYFELYGKDIETDGDPRDHPPWFYLDEGYSDSDGYLIFEEYKGGSPQIGTGHYKVREYIPEGWYNVGSAVYPTPEDATEYTPIIHEENDNDGSYVEDSFWLRQDMTVEFGNALQRGWITVYKFQDTDMTGEFDPEVDYMLGNWMFNLWTTDDGEPDEIIASGVTDAEGELVFEDIHPGDYIVQEVLEDGWENTTELLQPVTVYPGQGSEVWFGNVEYSDITVYKFYDSNYDGDWDEEELIDGFMFQLWSADEDGNPIATIGEPLETEEGMAVFEDLLPGYYVVQEIMPEVDEGECCWVSTTGVLRFVEVKSGGTYTLWFGNVHGGRIEGMKFLDVEATGEFVVGLDKPLMGWQINLWTNVDGYPGEIVDTAITDRSGEYSFECVVPGPYFVQEEMYEGWYNVTPAIVPVYVEPCETVYGIDFANCMYKDIYGIKFFDYDMDGVFDPEVDWVLEDWEIQLLNEEMEVIDTFYTLPNGYYFFEGLTVGTYYVREIVPEGWVSTTPETVEVVLNCCTPCMVVNFGNYELPQITIIKFYDADMDGEFGDDEELVTIPITFDMFGDLGDDVTVEFSLDVTGEWTFYVDVGYWRITENLPEGWYNTTPLIQDNMLGPGDHWTAHFGNIQFGDLIVYKFYDVEMTGEYDEEMDDLLEGWTFNLWTTIDGEPDEIIATDVTGAEGHAMFESLESGWYAVQEIEQYCWHPTTDVIQFVEIFPGETSELWFGNVPGANIDGYKFCDYNLNQEFDDHECGLEGWDIHLYEYPNNGETPQNSLPYMSTTTDEYGYYEFTCVRPGWYLLVEEMQEGWYNSTPYYYIIEVLPEDELRYDFGNYRHGDIYGLKYCDFNMNGEFDECLDWPLYGWEIQLWSADEYGNPIELIDTTYTDHWGMYRFEYLGPGDYVVAEVLKPCGWINTTDMEVHVRLGCVEEVEVNFGNYRQSDIAVKAYDYEMNEPVAGLVLYLWEADEYGTPIGEEPIAEGITGPHGYYIFPTYDPGYYVVQTADGYHSEFVILRCGTAYVVFEYYDYGYEETPQLYISKAEYVKLA